MLRAIELTIRLSARVHTIWKANSHYCHILCWELLSLPSDWVPESIRYEKLTVTIVIYHAESYWAYHHIECPSPYDMRSWQLLLSYIMLRAIELTIRLSARVHTIWGANSYYCHILCWELFSLPSDWVPESIRYEKRTVTIVIYHAESYLAYHQIECPSPYDMRSQQLLVSYIKLRAIELTIILSARVHTIWGANMSYIMLRAIELTIRLSAWVHTIWGADSYYCHTSCWELLSLLSDWVPESIRYEELTVTIVIYQAESYLAYHQIECPSPYDMRSQQLLLSYIMLRAIELTIRLSARVHTIWGVLLGSCVLRWRHHRLSYITFRVTQYNVEFRWEQTH